MAECKNLRGFVLESYCTNLYCCAAFDRELNASLCEVIKPFPAGVENSANLATYITIHRYNKAIG